MSDNTGLCPMCGQRVSFDDRTADGKWIGSCGDVFLPEAWFAADLDFGEQVERLLHFGLSSPAIVRALVDLGYELFDVACDLATLVVRAQKEKG